MKKLKISDSDKQHFETLSIEHMSNLYNNAARLARTSEEAEYLVQQTYALAFSVFEQYDKNTNFNKWLNEVLMFIYTNTCSYHQEPADTCLCRADAYSKFLKVNMKPKKAKIFSNSLILRWICLIFKLE